MEANRISNGDHSATSATTRSEEMTDIATEILRCYASGWTVREIAGWLSMTYDQVLQVLKNNGVNGAK